MKKTFKKHTNKIQKKGTNGITLIALVITIIVLLILAGISITMLSGDNSILNNATRAKDATRGGEVQETVNLAATSNAGVNYIEGTKKTRADVINELHTAGKLTDEEVEILEESNIITIGGITIDFSVLGSTGNNTLGAVYDSGDLKIGDKLTYSSNGQSDWIVFGKDTTGNILITTELPIENGFNLKGGAEAWLKYEFDTDTDSEYDLNQACSTYGGTIQGTQVNSRSIKMEDINYVAGLTPKTVTVDGNTYHIQSFDTYTFGSDVYNATNKTANYWYPVLSGGTGPTGTDAGFWMQPSSENQEPFDNNWYSYYCDWESGNYFYYGTDTNGDYISASTVELNTDNLQYIWGGNTEETCYKDYLVASRSVLIRSGGADFGVACVSGSEVNTDVYNLCSSDSSRGDDYEDIGSIGIRPVVSLPSNLKVEEKEGGTYDLAE